jgi:hypothetical protein
VAAPGDLRIASTRRVLRAAEVPLLAEAQQLRDRGSSWNVAQARVQAASDAARPRFAQGLAEGRAAARDDIASQINALAAARSATARGAARADGRTALQVARKLIGSFATPDKLVGAGRTAARDVMPRTA